MSSARPTSPSSAPSTTPRLLRIQEVAAELGLTTRSIRYYEEIGLRYIKGLRDDAGFSLAEIAQLLEDEVARSRNQARFRESHDATERRAIVTDALARVNRQVSTVRAKADRLETMIAEAETRRAHLLEHLAAIDAEIGGDPNAAAAHERAAHAPATGRARPAPAAREAAPAKPGRTRRTPRQSP